MPNAIVVLNAGSSSIKFSLFLERGETLEPDVRGQIEGLFTKAHFVSKAPDGTVKAETILARWGSSWGMTERSTIWSPICGRNWRTTV